MERNLIITEDGSHSIYVPELDENYHSTHGAIQESMHVFIESGFNIHKKKALNILEIGFGTGLNALLTLINCEKYGNAVRYFGIEKFPLTEKEFSVLNYTDSLGEQWHNLFIEMHKRAWNAELKLTSNFSLHKIEYDANSLDLEKLPPFDLIYFDAFAPNKQVELWNRLLFQRIYDHSAPEAIFVTYCAKGIVRRDLQSVGFNVERIPGPPGKKEMLRAIKLP